MFNSKNKIEDRIKKALDLEAKGLADLLSNDKIDADLARRLFDEYWDGVAAGVEAAHGPAPNRPELEPHGEFYSTIGILINDFGDVERVER
ncbi:hypothetical protein [Xanthomonas sp. XNM01]|uniref:hypothetical protein n=1 Tax=Xanthomonas sp. XNM01 TaxID=2769289 RepID=UPI0017833337|nr:hypothetical protein [Xanthomonas sp. XNM01]MBD9369822.1 hypothetical protein [Xanthomonas sp. XNM01]